MPPVQKPTRPPLPPASLLPVAPVPPVAVGPAPTVASYLDRAAGATGGAEPVQPTLPYFDNASAYVGAVPTPPNPTLASAGMVFRPPPPNKAAPQEPVNPTADQLRKRIGAKQWFLQQLGLEWTPTDEEVEEESKHLPEDGSIVKYSIPDSVAVQKREEKEPELILDFEPFDPEDSEKWVEVASINKGQQEMPPLTAAVKPLPTAPNPMPTPAPTGVLIPQEGPGAAKLQEEPKSEVMYGARA
jgi:hypothetical protein